MRVFLVETWVHGHRTNLNLHADYGAALVDAQTTYAENVHRKRNTVSECLWTEACIEADGFEPFVVSPSSLAKNVGEVTVTLTEARL